jgi:beta-N-acetylhexosaminidase
MKPGHIVFDLDGLELSAEEKELLEHPSAAGIILFTRNFASKKQLSSLIQAIKKIRPYLMISVDQEGGRVQRFKESFSIFPPMSEWGEHYPNNAAETLLKLQKNIRLLCQELQDVGVNFNFIPVLDIDYGISEIMKSRSLHSDPEIVIQLAKVLIETVHACAMPVTGKHFPGHGGVKVDSHLALPEDHRDWDTLWNMDLKPFKQLSPMLDSIMTAHIVYPAIDALPATYSPFWLKDVLRKRCQFEGLIISDDLCMGGAAYIPDYKDRAKQAFDAGCDILLVCNNREGAIKVLEKTEQYNNSESRDRIHQCLLRDIS